ncbi:hypothetical protein LAD67_05765 [Escherichia coli]|nr:hypothetical protein [Escherichia coli]
MSRNAAHQPADGAVKIALHGGGALRAHDACRHSITAPYIHAAWRWQPVPDQIVPAPTITTDRSGCQILAGLAHTGMAQGKAAFSQDSATAAVELRAGLL